MSLGNPITVLTFNSAEVVEALAAMKAPGEMLGQGDVYKIDIQKRMGKLITYKFPENEKIAPKGSVVEEEYNHL